MSIRVSHWAWSVALPPTSKLLLMALADIADDVGACWPSHPALAAKCNLSDRTVRRVLILLQTQQLVFIEPRFKTNGSRTSNRYRLAIDTPQDNLSGATAIHGRGVRSGRPPTKGASLWADPPALEASLPMSRAARPLTSNTRGRGSTLASARSPKMTQRPGSGGKSTPCARPSYSAIVLSELSAKQRSVT